MTYLVFARKYRPQTFEDVVGQESVVTALRNAVVEDRLGHAYLFVGPRGVGKTSIARILAKAINCPKSKDGRPCNACPTCEAVSVGGDIDVIEFDAASNTHLEDIQEKILDSVQYRPIRAKFKIYIVDEVHMISKHAFNALLKTLEEPPSHVKFIFATTEAHKIPETIISRCQRYDFKAITGDDIVRRLGRICEQEKVKVEAGALEYVARLATGGMRDAQSLLDQAIAFTGGEALSRQALHDIFGTVESSFLAALFEGVLDKRYAEVFQAVADLQRRGKDLGLFLAHAADFVRDLLIHSVGADASLLHVEPELHAAVDALAARCGAGRLQLMLQMLAEAEQRMRSAGSPSTLVELTLLRMAELDAVESVGELIRRLESLQAGAAVAPRSPVSSASTPARTASSGGGRFDYLKTGASRPAAAPQAAPPASAPAPVAPAPAKQAESAPAKKEAPAKAAKSSSRKKGATQDYAQALRDRWDEVLKVMGMRNRRLQGYCKDVTVEDASQDKLVLGIPEGYTAHRQFLEDFNNRNAIVDAIEEVVGTRYVLGFSGSTLETLDAPPEPDDERKNDTRMLKLEDVQRDPLIRDALNLFGGRITDIQ